LRQVDHLGLVLLQGVSGGVLSQVVRAERTLRLAEDDLRRTMVQTASCLRGCSQRLGRRGQHLFKAPGCLLVALGHRGSRVSSLVCLPTPILSVKLSGGLARLS
jgi:hypothetical protein